MSRIAFLTFFMGFVAILAQGCNDSAFSTAKFSQGANDELADNPTGGNPTTGGPLPTPTPTLTVRPPLPSPTPTIGGPLPTPTPTVTVRPPEPSPTPTIGGPLPTPTPTVTVRPPEPSPTPTVTIRPPMPSPTPQPSVVCDPFGGTSGPNALNGIEAQLTYLPADGKVVKGNISTQSFAPGSSEVVVSPAKLILSMLNVPTRPFTEGFSVKDSNDKLKNAKGENLIEYFSVRARANLRLTSSNAEGDYEFALLSDDGSMMELDPSGKGNAFESWISNDGVHPNTLGCSIRPLSMKKGDEYPFKMNYYQGPRVRIAMMLLWRHKTSSSVHESECGVSRGDSYYFNPTASSVSDPTANYTALISRGWSPVKAENFILPDQKLNPCAK